jgi:hypothetical protein
MWHLSASFRSYRVEAMVVEGNERGTGEAVTSFYMGDQENFGFVFKRLFSDFTVVDRHEGVLASGVRKWITRHAEAVDLLFLDVELLYCRMLRGEPFLRIPHWVRQQYRVPGTWEGVLKSLRKNTRSTDLRKVRKYGLSYRITKAELDFRDFYYHMHKPYLQQRFDDLVIIEPEWRFMRQCRKGELMQVVRDGQVLAGVLLHKAGGRLAYVWVGVKEDISPDMYKGVFSAMYYYTLLYGYESGCEEIDFLGTRPVLNDGLFRYKRKWGTYVTDSPVPRGDILLRPNKLNLALRSFFSGNCFVARDGRELVGKVLFDSGVVCRSDLEGINDRLMTPGLRCVQVYSTCGFEEEAVRWRETGSASLELVDLNTSPDPALRFCGS